MILSVVLPSYNEKEALPQVLQDWRQQSPEICARLGLKRIDLIFVDDGSTDGSFDHWTSQESLRIIRHEQNLGYGRSLKSGFMVAKGDWIVFHDCDQTCRAQDIYQLWALRDSADLVVGQRIHSMSRMPWKRRFGNGIYRFLFWILFAQRPHDLCSGYRLFHRKWIPDFVSKLPSELNFTLAMSLWMTRHQLKIVECPIRYEQRAGTSKLAEWKEGWRFLYTLLKGRFFSSSSPEAL